MRNLAVCTWTLDHCLDKLYFYAPSFRGGDMKIIHVAAYSHTEVLIDFHFSVSCLNL